MAMKTKVNQWTITSSADEAAGQAIVRDEIGLAAVAPPVALRLDDDIGDAPNVVTASRHAGFDAAMIPRPIRQQDQEWIRKPHAGHAIQPRFIGERINDHGQKTERNPDLIVAGLLHQLVLAEKKEQQIADNERQGHRARHDVNVDD